MIIPVTIGWGAVQADGSNSNPMHLISTGDPISRSAFYTIPAEKIGIINYMRFIASSNMTDVEFKFLIGLFGDTGFTPSIPFQIESVFVFQPLPPIAYPPKTDIGFMAIDGSAGARISVGSIIEFQDVAEE